MKAQYGMDVSPPFLYRRLKPCGTIGYMLRSARARRFGILLLALTAPLTTAQAHDGNFSQYSGWAAWRAAHPPKPAAANEAERALLARHRPRIYLPRGHDGLIDFYRDYIGSGYLVTGDGQRMEPVTREQLNAHKNEPHAVFTHRPRTPAASGRPTVYARYDEADVDLGAAAARRFAFLTYHAVFRRSGIAAGLTGIRALALDIAGDLDDWHQLDHYTAATVVLDGTRCPVALMLQQHNYLRTFVYGESLPAPADGRPGIDVAIRSNELYPHAPERRTHRAVNFLTSDNLRYLMGFAAAPWNAAEDVTEGVVEADYALEYLPQDDAFYVFQGFLGERRSLPGRDAPPGADYNTLPQMKPLALQLASGYWREGNRDDLARLDSTWARDGDARRFVQAQAVALRQALRTCR